MSNDKLTEKKMIVLEKSIEMLNQTQNPDHESEEDIFGKMIAAISQFLHIISLFFFVDTVLPLP